MERDGTAGGLRIAWSADPGDSQTVACTGITSTGNLLGFFNQIGNPPTAGSVQVFSNAQAVQRVQCHFGNAYETDHTTSVDIIRSPGDNYWVGFLTSTFNQ